MDGNYAVQIVYNGCVDTSDCINVTGVYVDEIVRNQTFATIYPNPGNKYVTVRFNKSVGRKSIAVLNNLGQSLQSIESSTDNVVLDMSCYSDGVYFIEVGTDSGVERYRWVKNSWNE